MFYRRFICYWVVVIIVLSVCIGVDSLDVHAQWTSTQMTSFENYTGQEFNTNDIEELKDWELAIQFPKECNISYLPEMVMAMFSDGTVMTIVSKKYDKELSLEDYLAEELRTARAKEGTKKYELIGTPKEITINDIRTKELTISAEYQFGGLRSTYKVVFVSGQRGYSIACQTEPANLPQVKKICEPIVKSLRLVPTVTSTPQPQEQSKSSDIPEEYAITIKGRLISEEHSPLQDRQVTVVIIVQNRWGINFKDGKVSNPEGVTDSDGKFTIIADRRFWESTGEFSLVVGRLEIVRAADNVVLSIKVDKDTKEIDIGDIIVK